MPWSIRMTAGAWVRIESLPMLAPYLRNAACLLEGIAVSWLEWRGAVQTSNNNAQRQPHAQTPATRALGAVKLAKSF